MRTLYHSELAAALFFLVLGGSFAVSAGRAIAVIGLRWDLVFLCLLAVCSIGAGVCILLIRVGVDGSGLARRAPFEGGFRASWEEVESWWVHRGGAGDEALPQARFRLRGRRDSVVVYAADVARPGFDAFLEDVRARVGDRETGEDSATTDRPRD